MPVRKLRSVEQMQVPGAEQTAGAHLRAAVDLSALCRWLRPWETPGGVHRSGSIDDAQELRRRWEAGPDPSSANC